jgi:tetratricopeptide (TPR) repeat protein
MSLGRWIEQAGNLERARDLYREAIRRCLRDDLLYRTMFDLALIEKKLGAHDASVALLSDLAAIRNEHRVEALEALAKHYEHREKNYEMALEFTETALQSSPQRRVGQTPRPAVEEKGQTLLRPRTTGSSGYTASAPRRGRGARRRGPDAPRDLDRHVLPPGARVPTDSRPRKADYRRGAIVYFHHGVYGDQTEVNRPRPSRRARTRAGARDEERDVAACANHLILRPAAIYGPGRGVHVSLLGGRHAIGATVRTISAAST